MTEVIVLFEVTVQEGKMDEYLRMAASLREELAKADGFISAERFSSVSTNGRLLSKSVWRDEESVAKMEKSGRTSEVPESRKTA